MALGDGEPRWHPDFWGAYAEAVAARTAERGGTVITAPFDAPPFKQAVLSDPQGGMFSVSQLVTD